MSVADHPLHRGRRIHALGRWVRLELSNRLTPTHQIAVPFVDSSVLNWPIASTSVMICARYGLGEYTDMAFVLHALRKGDLFCDVGANAGTYTVLAGHGVGCHVIAMEPVPEAFDLLMQNIYANGLSDRVDARNAGAGSVTGRLHFTSSLWSYNHVVGPDNPDSIEVQVFPLDTLLGGRIPTLIKIDVEGFEPQVVGGARQTLRDPALKAVLIEMWPGHMARYGHTPEDVLSVLQEAGLSGPFWYDPSNRKLVAAGTGSARNFNQIFVRDPNFIHERTKNSLAHDINGHRI